jgi:hypothetical protein
MRPDFTESERDMLVSILDDILSHEEIYLSLGGQWGDPIRETLCLDGRVTLTGQEASLLLRLYPETVHREEE